MFNPKPDSYRLRDRNFVLSKDTHMASVDLHVFVHIHATTSYRICLHMWNASFKWTAESSKKTELVPGVCSCLFRSEHLIATLFCLASVITDVCHYCSWNSI